MERMAVVLASGIATQVLMKLGSEAFQQIALAWGAKDDIRKLERTVSAIIALLDDAEEQGVTNRQVADWLQKLSDAFYDADDLLDDFSTQLLRRQVMTRDKNAKEVRIFFSRSNQIAFSFKIAYRVKAIRQTLDAIYKDKRRFSFTERPLKETQSVWREETHSFVRTQNVVGRIKEKTTIVDRLLVTDENVEVTNENVEIHSIVGIGGLGKTTLAQFVYNDEKVTKLFVLKMWACVSDPFDVKSIAQKIIESATQKEEPKNIPMDVIQTNLRKLINGNKYFLVLDDVWNEDYRKWLELIDLLTGGARGSKILVTTRLESVARTINSRSPLFLEGLSQNESWDLFEKFAFKENDDRPPKSRVLKIGEAIAVKCRGVPLAIVAIASLLRQKNTVEEWESIKESDMLKIAREEDIILPILKLSYLHLPLPLKRCFAFCSFFPKDTLIRREDLIQLWIANGLIRREDGNSNLEAWGDSYFMGLVTRSLFDRVVNSTIDDSIICCKMHDLVHDLAQLVSGSRSTILNLSGNGVNASERTHHVYFGYDNDSSENNILSSLLRAKKLRTFLLQNQQLNWNHRVVNKLGLEKIVTSFKKLRVLDLHGTRIEMVPSCIGKLKHLRYLDLSHNWNIKFLPNSITKLQNLQTLKVTYCKLEGWPKDMRKLISLRHLELMCCDKLRGMPSGIGQLRGICKLTDFIVESYRGLSELKCLDNLRGDLWLHFKAEEYLGSIGQEGEEFEKANYLNGKQHLEGLLLFFNSKELDEWVVEEGLRPHPNMKTLNIYKYKGDRFP